VIDGQPSLDAGAQVGGLDHKVVAGAEHAGVIEDTDP